VTDPLLVFPTSSCSPPSAARFFLSFRPDPCPQNRIGEGSLRSGEGSGGGVPWFSSAEVVRGQDRIVPLYILVSGRRHFVAASLAEWFPGIEAAFVSIACRDGWNGRELAGCRAVSLDWTLVVPDARAREQNRYPFFFFLSTSPPSVSNSNHLGRTNCCCLPLES
jgi:hypothetical protein